MVYVDGFVLPIPKKNLKAYRSMAQKAGKIFRDLGALEFRECVADDLKPPMGMGFPALVKPKSGETILFSWITYKSRAQRDAVNEKIMKDPRLEKLMAGKPMPFDVERMACAGFKAIVDL